MSSFQQNKRQSKTSELEAQKVVVILLAHYFIISLVAQIVFVNRRRSVNFMRVKNASFEVHALQAF